MKTVYSRRAVVLGLLSAMGPFAIDMYLPALPALGRSIHADARSVQWTLMAFFLAMGSCQLLYGPLSDMFGRKPPLIAGLVLFVLTSIACGLATSIESLIAWRTLQGVGACATTVTPRAMVRDLYTGAEAARLMSLLMLVFSVSPLLAPLAGSVAIGWASWRAVFFATAVLGGFGLVLATLGLEETRPPTARVESTLQSVLASYGRLVRDRRFVGLSFVAGFGMATFFAYLANSSFVLIEHFGLTPSRYSLFFALNAVAFIGSAQLTGMLTRRHGLTRVVLLAVTGHALAMLALCLAWVLGASSLALLASMLFVGYGCLGLVIPSTVVIAMDAHGPIAGTASALFGTVQMVTGAVMIALLGLWTDGTPWPMIAGIGLCASITCALTWTTLGLQRT